MCWKSIVTGLGRARSSTKRKEILKGTVARAKPDGQLVFEVWLSGYRKQLEELCSSQAHPEFNESQQPNQHDLVHNKIEGHVNA